MLNQAQSQDPDQQVSVFDELNDSAATSHVATNTAKAEIARYIALPVGNMANVDLIQWWDLHSSLFPRLHKQFLQIAFITSCSASIERLFSHGGNTLTAKRNRLDPETLEQLVILNKNKTF